jgi:hypothetical protein
MRLRLSPGISLLYTKVSFAARHVLCACAVFLTWQCKVATGVRVWQGHNPAFAGLWPCANKLFSLEMVCVRLVSADEMYP